MTASSFAQAWDDLSPEQRAEAEAILARLEEPTPPRGPSQADIAIAAALKARAIRRKTRQKGSARTPTPEVLYKDAIKAGHVRVVRRRGKGPLIQWLDDAGRPL